MRLPLAARPPAAAATQSHWATWAGDGDGAEPQRRAELAGDDDDADESFVDCDGLHGVPYVCPMCALVGADAGFDACCVPYLEFADVFLLICVVLLPYNAISRLCLSRPEWETHIVFGRALCGSFCASADARTAVPFVV